jgi:hypothetical protein
MYGEKNNAKHAESQNNPDEKHDTTPDAAHDLLLFRMYRVHCMIKLPP